MGRSKKERNKRLKDQEKLALSVLNGWLFTVSSFRRPLALNFCFRNSGRSFVADFCSDSLSRPGLEEA
jgi:hypothetical protein